MSGMRVWIDQDLCTGDGICAEIAPAIFEMDDDGLAYVKEKGWPNRFGPSGGSSPAAHGPSGTVPVPDDVLDPVIEAAEECPGECIFIEPADA
ncbi:MAG TPA: ferredoxin [Acidimicrobiales bacterium]|nr:ferredoxin [Acidimicrobiales bacterium]